MTGTLLVDFNQAWKQTGEQVKNYRCAGGDLVGPRRITPAATPTFFIVLLWPRAANYLEIRARHSPPGAIDRGEPTTLFVASDQLARQVISVENLRENRFLIATLKHDSVVEFDFLINTDDPSFLAKQPEGEEGVTETIHVNALAIVPGPEKQVLRDYKKIALTLRPAQDMKTYQGYVALDLGNTTSTLVSMLRRAHGEDEIQVVDVEKPYGKPYPDPIASALQIRKLLAQGTADAYADFRCDVGQPAMRNSNGEGLFLGAKRLLADQPDRGDDSVSFFLEGRRTALQRRDPAELFVAEMLRGFHHQEQAFPAQVVLTCPTTFSSWEVNQLKEAVFHAWKRSRREKKQTPSAEQVRDAVPWVIDEASAAAFYFVYKDFLRAAGRVPAFRYVYPKGMNLLLYDCGGGTTDIALVNVTAQDNRNVRVRVLGRAGHRNFGGDNITIAVYRLLKAKLAAALDPSGLPFPHDQPAEIPGFLEENAAAIDRCIPSGFDARTADLQSEDVRRRMQATMNLWSWAERIKIQLSAADDDGSPRSSSTPVNERPTDPELKAIAAVLTPSRLASWETAAIVNGPPICRDEVDCLVRGDIRETIRYASYLVEARLPRGAEVNWVYVVGNASRYPLIKQMLRDPDQGLPIRFIDERFCPVKTKDLKNSVAKGALLALWVAKENRGIQVDFEQELMDRLPFDITFNDLGRTYDRTLFHEHKLYRELGPQSLTIAALREGQPNPEVITFGRCWPGDPEPRPYLRFQFPRPITGEFRVWFEKADRRFYMQQKADGESRGPKVPGHTVEGLLYNSPVQGGEGSWPRPNRD